MTLDPQQLAIIEVLLDSEEGCEDPALIEMLKQSAEAWDEFQYARHVGKLFREDARRITPPQAEIEDMKARLRKTLEDRSATPVPSEQLERAWLRDTSVFASYTCDVARIVHPDGRGGWVLKAVALPPGEYNLEVLTDKDRSRRQVRGVVLRIPDRFRGKPTEALLLAGASEGTGSYELLESIKSAAEPDAILDAPIEAVIAEQERGVMLVAFIDDNVLKQE